MSVLSERAALEVEVLRRVLRKELVLFERSMLEGLAHARCLLHVRKLGDPPEMAADRRGLRIHLLLVKRSSYWLAILLVRSLNESLLRTR